jgi:hypothetical protein
MALSDGSPSVRGTKSAPPGALYENFEHILRISAFPSGELIFFGRPHQEGPLLARHWAPGGKVVTHSVEKLLAAGAEVFYPSLLEVAPNEVYAYAGKRVARWDGSVWRGLAASKREIKSLHRIADDELWSQNDAGAIERITKSEVGTVAIPEPLQQIAGTDRGDIWALSKSGKILHREGEAWTVKSAPAPVFSSGNAVLKLQSLSVLAPNDVLLVGRYWEKAPSWKDQELRYVMFRSRAMTETFRCNEPDPENNRVEVGQGFQSWPPTATEQCSTPFVVLARRSNQRKNVDDWPRLRAAFKGQDKAIPDLGEELALREFVSGNRTFVGVMAKSLDAAKKLASLVTKADPLRPEIVCGDPIATRTVTVNLASGAATIK